MNHPCLMQLSISCCTDSLCSGLYIIRTRSYRSTKCTLGKNKSIIHKVTRLKLLGVFWSLQMKHGRKWDANASLPWSRRMRSSGFIVAWRPSREMEDGSTDTFFNRLAPPKSPSSTFILWDPQPSLCKAANLSLFHVRSATPALPGSKRSRSQPGLLTAYWWARVKGPTAGACPKYVPPFTYSFIHSLWNY